MRISVFAMVCLAGALGSGCLILRGDDQAGLVVDGRSDYVIVCPDKPDCGNAFALKELQKFLQKASGVSFPSVSSAKAPAAKRIFLGISERARKVLGGDPRDGLAFQEHCVKTVGTDLFLYGKGAWGDMYAVYDFLENVLGFRWYDARGGMKVPDCRQLPWRPLNRKTVFSVPHRKAIGYWIYHRPQAHEFCLRNRQNSGLISLFLQREGVEVPDAEQPVAIGSHTLPSYIPGDMDQNTYRPYGWLKNKNYWKTNPEFFGLGRDGKRHGRTHLCFSNPGLRKELTRNVLENMRRQPDRRVFSVSQHDSPGRFCNCPACLALEKRYGTIGGPMFDYLIELAGAVKQAFPQNFISFLVYRKAQTQRPPQGIDRLPDNLLPVFAPIDDDFSHSWEHPHNRESRKDLEQWGKLSPALGIWYYPNSYCTGHYGCPPMIGNIHRLIRDIQIMVKAGMTHSYFEHDVGVPNMIGFTELQSFLILQLFKDVTQDPEALIDEFMAFEYGAAAPLMREFLADLEAETDRNQVYVSWDSSIHAMSHLTPENMVRWHGYFAKMIPLVKADSTRLYNVERVKVCLDFATLQLYNRIVGACPKFATSAEELADSVRRCLQRTTKDYYTKEFDFRGKALLKSMEQRMYKLLITAGKVGKPLPSSLFGRTSKEDLVQLVPFVHGRPLAQDSDAAWKVTAIQMKTPPPRLPYPMHLYDFLNKRYYPGINHVTRKTLGPRGKYAFYLVTKRSLPSGDCQLQLGADSWYQLKIDLGDAYEPGSLNRVEIYASLKFEGPAFYEEDVGKENRVLCDRVVVVKRH